MTNEPNEIALQPVARPTDQFAPKTVLRKLPGQSLLELGQALSSVSKDVNDITSTWIDRQNQADRMAGEADFATKNMQDFRQAAAEGKIGPAHPWYTVAAEQQAARNTVQSAMVSARDGLFSDPQYQQIAQSGDIKQVDDYYSRKLAESMYGMSAWGKTAALHEADYAKQRYLNDWAEYNQNATVKKMTEQSTTLIRQRGDSQLDPATLIGLHTGDPKAAGAMNNVIASTQAELQHLGSVMPWPDANKIVSEAILQMSRDHRDPEIAHQILSGLAGKDGAKLSDTADNRAALTNLPREIEQLTLMDLRTGNEARQQQAVKEAQGMMEQSKQWMKDQNVANLFDVKIPPAELAKHSPLAMQEFNRMIAAAGADYHVIKDTAYSEKLDDLTKQVYADAAAGKLTQPDFIRFGAAASLLGSPGRTALEQLTQFMLHQRGIVEGTTKPATLAMVNRLAQSGSLDGDTVLRAYENGDLSKQDTHTYLSIASTLQAERGKSVPMVQTALEQLENLVAAPTRREGVIQGEHAELIDKVEKAKSAFLEQFFNKLARSPGWSDLPLSEQQKQVGELRDAVATQADPHAPRYADWLKDFKSATAEPYAPKPGPGPAGPTTQPVGKLSPEQVQQQAKADPFAAALDRETIDSTRKALHVRADGTFRDVIEATNTYGPIDFIHLGTPELDALKGVRSQEYTVNAPGKDQIVDGQLVSLTKQMKVSIRNSGDQLGPYTADTLKREQSAHQSAMVRLQVLKPDAAEAVSDIRRITTEFNKTGKIDIATQQRLRTAAITVMAFQELRDQTGYSVDEVKQMGPGAWRQVPVGFANVADLRQRADEVAKQLGIKEVQFPYFVAAQLGMLKAMRQTAGAEPTESYTSERQPLFSDEGPATTPQIPGLPTDK